MPELPSVNKDTYDSTVIESRKIFFLRKQGGNASMLVPSRGRAFCFV